MNQLASEKIVIEDPFSFVGSRKRIWKITKFKIKIPDFKIKDDDSNKTKKFFTDWFNLSAKIGIKFVNFIIKFMLYWVALSLIVMAWCGILMWYMFFGILVVPFRLIKRSQRKQKRDNLRHRELLEALEQQKQK